MAVTQEYSTYLVTSFSLRYLAASSSGMSASLASNVPLKGRMGSLPLSWTLRGLGLRVEGFAHAQTWTHKNVYIHMHEAGDGRVCVCLHSSWRMCRTHEGDNGP